MIVTVFDIETASASELHSFGPGFYRIGAWKELDTVNGESSAVTITSNPYELVSALSAAQSLTGANIVGFDFMALAKYYSADYEALCAKAWDSLIVERHLSPVAAKGAQPTGYYKLDATAERYGAPAKLDLLPKLARHYGGYHLIPLDNEDYRRYLAADVEASAGVFLAQSDRVAQLSPADRAYIRREHAVAAVMGRITLEGFRVDVGETMLRWKAGQDRIDAGKLLMHEKYGMPLEGKKPHVTNLGKAAFRAALVGTGISEEALEANWPTNKDGSLSTGKDVLNGMIEVLEKSKPEAAELCRTMLAMNGERSVHGTILDNLVGDRVHAEHKTTQSSGRVSVTNPGLTVMKKPERDILLPDSDDEWLVAVDGSQIDARMVAALSGDAEYRKLFAPGLDMHNEIAERVFGKRDGQWRKLAKVAGHAWNYGAAASSLARNLGIDYSEAVRFDKGMTASFPRLVEWKAEVRAAAGVLAYGEVAPEGDSYRVLTNPYGRTVRVERSRAYTQSVGLLCQSATRDSMMHAILRLSPGVRRKIRAFVHDEIVVSVDRERAVAISHEIADAMAFDLLGVPITFSGGDVGPTWASCYS